MEKTAQPDYEAYFNAMKALQLLAAKHSLAVVINYAPRGRFSSMWRVYVMDRRFVDYNLGIAIADAAEYIGKELGYCE